MILSNKGAGPEEQHFFSCLYFGFFIKSPTGNWMLQQPLSGKKKKKSRRFCAIRGSVLCYQHNIHETSFLDLLDQTDVRTTFPQPSYSLLGDLSGLMFYHEYKGHEHPSPNIFTTCLTMLLNNTHMVIWETWYSINPLFFLFLELCLLLMLQNSKAKLPQNLLLHSSYSHLLVPTQHI